MSSYLSYVNPSATILMTVREFRAAVHAAQDAIIHYSDSRYNQGAKDERNRIINLLETEKFSLPAGLEGGTTYIPIEELIELIKGEQK
jgi:hypothetical protein